MTNETSYNGYTNYETWNVSLWIDNDQGEQEFWQEQAKATLEAHLTLRASAGSFTTTYVGTVEEDSAYALSQELQSHFEDNNPLADKPSTYSDMLSAALRVVNWYEIATNMIEQAKDA